MMVSISSIVRKVRIWGMKGVVDYFRARLQDYRWHKYFQKNAKLWNKDPIKGITIIGSLSTRGSVHKVLRDLCFSLKDAGIPFQTFDLGSQEVPSEDIQSIITPKSEFRVTKYTHLVEMLSSPIQDGLVPNRGRIVFWEFEDGIGDAYPVLNERPGTVLAMSDFNYKYYKVEFKGCRDVKKILYPLRIDISKVHTKESCRARFSLQADAFIVFYNFSYASGWNRKNPHAVITAFSKAFRNDPNAWLVLKTSSRSSHLEYAARLEEQARKEGVDERVIFIDDYLTQAELYDLTNACDIYISLHRSEGFGLGIAEAMMLKKVVVISEYSAPLEFCNGKNAILIPCQMVNVDCPDVPWYASASKWAEPDVEAAATALRDLRKDKARLQSLGDVAYESIVNQFSLDNFTKSVFAYLEEPGEQNVETPH